jgi:hypothetical protein
MAEEAPASPVDTRVESPVWEVVRPAAAPGPPRAFFVDGVRRIEHRLVVESGESTYFGLLGSYGVGATLLEARQARVQAEAVSRVLVVGGGERLPALEVAVPRGRARLRFEAQVVADRTPNGPLLGLQRAMREDEARLAQKLGEGEALVFLDGPLDLPTSAAGLAIGFVKRLIRTFLPAAEALLLPRLKTGERTPLFLIQDKVPRYSWYHRIATGRAIESPLAGVVRLETSAEVPLRQVQELAGAACALLPRLASDPAHDPRAPANLYPIGGLEQRLRRLLGDPLVIRRAIEAHLHELAAG